MRRFFTPILLLVALTTAGIVWATTYHAITVDGALADFSADEKTAGDPPGDWLYGPENDLSTLFATWDAQKLYLGFDYKAENTAVMYLIETGKAGGVSNLCRNAGYTGAFPANVQGPEFDLLVAFFAEPDHQKSTVPRLYALSGNASTEITSSAGVVLKVVEQLSSTGRTGSLEVAIPWDTIYSLGAGKVPASAKLRLAGVIRGSSDDDGLGDVSPDPTGGVKTTNCSGAATVLDKFFELSLDANGNGTPEPSWSPGGNVLHTDGGLLPDLHLAADQLPSPDHAMAKDTKPAAKDTLVVVKDMVTPKDKQTSNDLATEADARTNDATISDDTGLGKDARAKRDAKTQADSNMRSTFQEEGCACTIQQAIPESPVGLGFLLLLGAAILLAQRRGWGR